MTKQQQQQLDELDIVLEAVAAAHGDETGTLVPIDKTRDAIRALLTETGSPSEDGSPTVGGAVHNFRQPESGGSQ